MSVTLSSRWRTGNLGSSWTAVGSSQPCARAPFLGSRQNRTKRSSQPRPMSKHASLRWKLGFSLSDYFCSTSISVGEARSFGSLCLSGILIKDHESFHPVVWAWSFWTMQRTHHQVVRRSGVSMDGVALANRIVSAFWDAWVSMHEISQVSCSATVLCSCEQIRFANFGFSTRKFWAAFLREGLKARMRETLVTPDSKAFDAEDLVHTTFGDGDDFGDRS